jgi:hypothetical protein
MVPLSVSGLLMLTGLLDLSSTGYLGRVMLGDVQSALGGLVGACLCSLRYVFGGGLWPRLVLIHI